MARWVRLMLLGATITLLHACELGGAATPQAFGPAGGTTYSLATVQSLDPAFGLSFPLTGNDSAGGSFSGTYSVQNLPAATFNDQTAIPRIRTVALTEAASGAFTTTQETLHLGSGFQILGWVDNLTGVTCLPLAPFNVQPASATAGANGLLGTLSCSDGTRRQLSWRVDSAAGDRAGNVLITELSDISGVLLFTEEEATLIDATGAVHGVTLTRTDLTTGVTTTLQSPVI